MVKLFVKNEIKNSIAGSCAIDQMVLDNLSIPRFHYLLLVFSVYQIFEVRILFDICFSYQMITYCHTNADVLADEE